MHDQANDRTKAVAGRILRALRRNVVLILVFVGLCSWASWSVLQHLPPAYTATSFIWLGGREADIIASESALSAVPSRLQNTHEESRIMAAVIKSVPVLRRLVVSIGMHEEPDSFRSRLSTFVARLKAMAPWIETLAAAAGRGEAGGTAAAVSGEKPYHVASTAFAPVSRPDDVTETDAQSGDVARERGHTPEELRAEKAIRAAVAHLATHLVVNVDPRSEIAVIEYTGTDPVLAARIVNELPQAFAEERSERLRDETLGAVSWLAARVEAVREDLIASEVKLEDFVAENGLGPPDGDDRPQTGRLETYAQSVRRAHEGLDEARRRLERAHAALDTETVDPELFDSQVIQRLVALRADTVARRRDLLVRVGGDHALVEEVEKKVRGYDSDIHSEKERIVTSMEREVARYERELEMATDRLVAEREAILLQTGRVGGTAAVLTELQREAEANRALYANLLARLKEARQAAQFEIEAVRLIQPATVPSSPTSLSPVILVAAAGFGSLVFAFTMVAGLVIIDRRITSADQLSRFDFDAIVSAPYLATEARRPKRGGSGSTIRARILFEEALRRVLTLTLFADRARGDEGRVLLVTSGSKNEGKSTVARRLALYAAAAGTPTVLVEADLRRPGHFLRRVDRRNVGLAGFLAGRAPVEEIVTEDPASRLAILPTTETVQNSTELVASWRMRALLSDLRTRYRLIVIDTPPVCLTPDPEVLAPLADDVIFVVRHRSSTLDRTERGLEFIDRAAERPIVGFLNMTDSAFFSSYYGPGHHAYVAVPYKRRMQWLSWVLPRRKTRGHSPGANVGASTSNRI